MQCLELLRCEACTIPQGPKISLGPQAARLLLWQPAVVICQVSLGFLCARQRGGCFAGTCAGTHPGVKAGAALSDVDVDLCRCFECRQRGVCGAAVQHSSTSFSSMAAAGLDSSGWWRALSATSGAGYPLNASVRTPCEVAPDMPSAMVLIESARRSENETHAVPAAPCRFGSGQRQSTADAAWTAWLAGAAGLPVPLCLINAPAS
jgi:hypothetical protein